MQIQVTNLVLNFLQNDLYHIRGKAALVTLHELITFPALTLKNMCFQDMLCHIYIQDLVTSLPHFVLIEYILFTLFQIIMPIFKQQRKNNLIICCLCFPLRYVFDSLFLFGRKQFILKLAGYLVGVGVGSANFD